MSRAKSVVSVTKTSMLPPVPAGTIAAAATTVPVGMFNVETNGFGSPVGHVLRNPTGPLGTNVKFSEYACAPTGIPQATANRTGKVRLPAPISEGPPSGPVALRVSAMRHGVSG